MKLSLMWRRRLALVLLGGALAVLAGLQAGRIWPLIDAFAHLSGHIAGAALFAGIAVVWPRRLVVILVCGAAAVVAAHAGLAAYGQMRSGAVAGTESGGQALKVLSFNTWHSHPRPGRIAALVKREEPDIAILVEFGPDKLSLLRDLAEIYPYQTGCGGRVHCSVVIISKQPWVAAGSDGRDLSASPPMAWADFRTEAGLLRVIGVHIMRPIDGPWGHVKELDYIADRVRRHAGPSVVAGDYNATRWAHSLRRFEDRSGLRHMSRFLPSWPAGRRGWPQLAIDHMYASAEVAFREVRLGPDTGSDHLPLIATIEIGTGDG